MEIYWTSGAELNLLDAVDFVSADSPAAALKLGKTLRAIVEQLALTPAMGRAGRVARTRELAVPGTSYLVIYQVKDGTLQIIRLLHMARRWPKP